MKSKMVTDGVKYTVLPYRVEMRREIGWKFFIIVRKSEAPAAKVQN